jgi:hypothetical protein
MEGIDIGANTRTTTIPSLVMGEQMKAKSESELVKNCPNLEVDYNKDKMR